VFYIGKEIAHDVERVAANQNAYDPSVNANLPSPIMYNQSLNRPSPRAFQGERSRRAPREEVDESEFETQTMRISGDMVGCLIGKGGATINTIRRSSGVRLHIAEQEDAATDRLVTITGPKEGCVKAEELIRETLANEELRRVEYASRPARVDDEGSEDDGQIVR
jgi:KH domain